MRKRIKVILIIPVILITILLLMVFPRNYGFIETKKPNTNEYFRVMSYNIKNSYQDYDSWIGRRSEVVKLIKDYKPEIIGMQEADIEWIKYFEDELSDYEYYGVGRDYDGTYNEYNPIYYDGERFELINANTLWLSETPNEMSRGWDGACNRIVSFVTLKDKNTDEIFTYYNTHLDHEGKEALINGYKVISEQIESNEYPSILSGDFNTIPFSEVYKIASKELDDSKKIAETSMNFGTINYFTKFYTRFFPRIDYIFTTKNDFAIDRYAVIPDYKYEGKPISDHNPIFVDIKINNSNLTF